MVKTLDCNLEVSEFELQSHYYIHFQTNTPEKGIEPSYPHSYSTGIALVLNNPQKLICH